MTAPDPRRWRILGFLGVAQLMLILDITVVAIALPHIEADLGLSRIALTWTVSAYTLAFGGLLLLGGRIADLVGAKRVVLTGLLLFTAASLVTGLADTAGVLLAGRVAQGVGAALLSPAALSLVVTLFDGDERNRALGVWSALGGGGAALGVLLGGLLTAGPGWPWVFYVNVPIGVVIAVALARMLPPVGAAAPRARLDLLGAAAGHGVDRRGDLRAHRRRRPGLAHRVDRLAVLLGAVGYLAFVVWQRRAGSPLMDVALLARRPVATGTFLILMATALMIAVFFLGTFYFQHARGYGALRTGLLFLPVALATMLGANLTGRAIGRVGARPLAVAGLIVAAVGMAAPALRMHPTAVVLGVAVGGGRHRRAVRRRLGHRARPGRPARGRHRVGHRQHVPRVRRLDRRRRRLQRRRRQPRGRHAARVRERLRRGRRRRGGGRGRRRLPDAPGPPGRGLTGSVPAPFGRRDAGARPGRSPVGGVSSSAPSSPPAPCRLVRRGEHVVEQRLPGRRVDQPAADDDAVDARSCSGCRAAGRRPAAPDRRPCRVRSCPGRGGRGSGPARPSPPAGPASCVRPAWDSRASSSCRLKPAIRYVVP